MDHPEDGSRLLGRKAVLLAAGVLTVMAGATIAPALPAIEDAFRKVPNVRSLAPLVLTVPGLSIAVVAPLAGALIDRFGRKVVLIVGLILYGLAGSSGTWVETLDGLLTGRVLLGVSVAAVMTCSVTLAADYFSGPERDRFLGFLAAASGVGAAVILVAGGFLTDADWRFPFFLYLGAFLVLPAAAIALKEPRRPFLPAEPEETVPADGTIPWPTIVFLYALAMFGMILIYLVPLKLPFYLRQLSGASAAEVGLAIGGAILLSALISFQYGRIRRHASYQAIFAAEFVLIAIGFGILAIAGSYWVAVVAMAACGLGFGLEVPNINVWTAAVAPARARGRLIGGLTTCFYLGQFVSPFVAYLLIPSEDVSGIAAMYGVAGGTSALIGLCFAGAVLIRRRRNENR